MLQGYIMGLYFGRFLAGAIVGGIVPSIIFIVKKRWGLAFLSFLACGLLAFVHSLASIIAGVILIICAIKAQRNFRSSKMEARSIMKHIEKEKKE